MTSNSRGISDSQDVLSKCLQEKLSLTRNVLKEALEKYQMNEIFLSFNGGKDCTILLHVLHELLGKSIEKLRIYYLRSSDPFEEIESFVKSCESHYNVKIIETQADSSMKEVLTQICDNDKKIKACIMGTRRSDPWSNKLQSFQQTDRGWPELMRVNPILDWTVENVWEYLIKKKVPYCSLYDRGYTSIGNKRNTRPNPFLANRHSPGTFHEAFNLLDDSLERSGRC